MYLARRINRKILQVRPKLLKDTKYKRVVNLFNKEFNWKSLDFQFEVTDKIEPNTYAVAGTYDMYEDFRQVIFYFSDKQDTIKLTKEELPEFHFLVSQVIQHESIHQCQYANRRASTPCEETNPKKLLQRIALNERQEYLSAKEEIDAYAHDIAMEIKFYYQGSDPYEILVGIDNAKKIYSYHYYRKTFVNDPKKWDTIRHKLLSKAYRWLPYAE